MLIMRFNYLYFAYYLGWCVIPLALGIRGEKVVWKDGGDVPLQSGRDGHVAAFLCEVLYLTFLATMIRPGGRLRSNPPRDIRLLKAWGCRT